MLEIILITLSAKLPIKSNNKMHYLNITLCMFFLFLFFFLNKMSSFINIVFIQLLDYLHLISWFNFVIFKADIKTENYLLISFYCVALTIVT